MFGDTDIEKHKFHHYKNPIFLKDVKTNNILLSNNVSSCEKNITTSLVT